MLGDHRVQPALVRSPQRFHHATFFDHDERRHRRHTVLGCDRRELVDIDLEKHAVRVLRCELLLNMATACWIYFKACKSRTRIRVVANPLL